MTTRDFCILYVDDDENDISLAKFAAESAGISSFLQTVSSAPQAIEYLHGEGLYADRSKYPLPKVILLDLRMPRMNGFDFLQWLRSKPDFLGMVVIIFSASAHPEDIRRAWDLGANAFVQKPSSLGELSKFLQLLKTFWADFHQFLPPAEHSHLDKLPKAELTP